MEWVGDFDTPNLATARQSPKRRSVRVLSKFQQVSFGQPNYQVPVISLDKGTSKEAVCTVFEKVNTGGVTLSVFELVTASFAAGNFRLREDWDKRRRRMNSSFGPTRDQRRSFPASRNASCNSSAT